MPNVVKRKMDAVRGTGAGGKLLEEEEVERLEREGYRIGGEGAQPASAVQRGGGEERVEVDDAEARRLREEELAFAREIADAEAEGHGGGVEEEENEVGGMVGKRATVEDVSDQDE